MKSEMVLGGYLINADGVRHQLPVVVSPDNLMVDCAIKKVSEAGKGVVQAQRRPCPELGPYELVLYVDASNLLLMLSEHGKTGDHCVRTPANKNAEDRFINILGEKYPAKSIVRDIEFVSAAFKEFIQTGDVSTSLLN